MQNLLRIFQINKHMYTGLSVQVASYLGAWVLGYKVMFKHSRVRKTPDTWSAWPICNSSWAYIHSCPPHPPAFTWHECSSSITVYYSIADVNRRIKRGRFDNKITKEALPAGSQPKDVATVVCEATQLQGVWSGSKLTSKHTSTTSGCLVRFKAHWQCEKQFVFPTWPDCRKLEAGCSGEVILFDESSHQVWLSTRTHF